MAFNCKAGRYFIVVLLVILFVAPAKAAEPFKIALFEPFSGPFKHTGDAYLKGLEFLADEVNKKGGILGRNLEFVATDTLMKPDITVRKANKLVLEGVKVFAGTSGTHIAQAIAQVANAEKVFFISNAAEGLTLTGKDCSRYTFRTGLNTEMRGLAIAHFLATTPYRRFAIVNQDYAMGHEAAEGFKRAVKQLIPASQIVAEEFHPLALKDFGPYISKVKAGNPEVIFTSNWEVDLINLIKQSREFGLKVPFMTYFLDMVMVSNPDVANYSIGSWAVEGWFATVRTAQNKEMLQEWIKNSHYREFQNIPNGPMGRSINGIMHFLEAIKRAGSFDVEKIIQTWEGMKWEGLTGPMIMRAEDHQMLLPIYIVQIIPPTNEFYPNLPFLGEPTMIPLEKCTVPLSETGCKRKK